MRRAPLLLLSLAVVLMAPGAALADHPAPAIEPLPVPDPAVNQGGEGTFEIIETLVTLNPHTDVDFFERGGITYASIGTLAVGPNEGGQTIIQLTDDKGAVTPEAIKFLAGHPSAACPSNPQSALGLQHDVEATPKGQTISNSPHAKLTQDAQLLLDSSDARGRCHDGGVLGLTGAPLGGLEIIDITNPQEPVEIGLTSHIGEAHTVNVDPRRPHIAYAVSSDSVSVVDGKRMNEPAMTPNAQTGVMENNPQRYRLDGFEVVDLSSCMYFPAGSSTEQKRAQCRPEVYRYRYPSVNMALGHKNTNAIYGCHELEVYPNDRLTCGGGAAMLLFDMSGAFDDNGTPNDFTDDKPRGKRLSCSVRESTSVALFQTDAKVTDCVNGTAGADSLSIPAWLKGGAPSLTGVKHLGSAYHQGRQGNGEDVIDPAFGSAEDIDFDHEAELTRSGKFVIASDERGGGVAPPGAACSPGLDNPVGNGGLHAYAVDRLDQERPKTAEEAWDAYARTPKGDKSIFRAEVRTQPTPTICTAHVFQQVPGENRIFMGWYSQGTRVVDYRENKDGTFEFNETAYFIPLNANTWVSHVFKVDRQKNGDATYYGLGADFTVGEGRPAIDIYKVTLPSVKTAFARADARNRGGRNGNGSGTGTGTSRGGGSGGLNSASLPATGGAPLLLPGLMLLGTSAYVGRRRRRGRTDG